VLGLLSLRRLAERDELVLRLSVSLQRRGDLLCVLLAKLALAPVLCKLVGRLGNATLISGAHETSLRVGDSDAEVGRGLTVLRSVRKPGVSMIISMRREACALVAHLNEVLDGGSHYGDGPG
jgi:hypothetical protein